IQLDGRRVPLPCGRRQALGRSHPGRAAPPGGGVSRTRGEACRDGARALTLFGFLREQLHQRAPALRSIDSRLHLFGATAVPLEVAVLQIDTGRAVADRREAHLDLARLREIGLILPVGRDLPREYESARRFPHDDRSPRTIGAVLLLAVAPAADAPFDDGSLHRRASDVMASRPPCIESFGEHAERPLRAGPDRHALLYRRRRLHYVR